MFTAVASPSFDSHDRTPPGPGLPVPPVVTPRRLEEPTAMLHFSCDICGKDLSPEGAGRFVVKMEAFAATDPAQQALITNFVLRCAESAAARR